MAQDDTGAQLEEIIVTAQRRGENLQSVPIAVSAATGEQLEKTGVRTLADIAVVAPAVTLAPSVGSSNIAIRGVGGTGAGSDEPANAVYVDGVYQASPGGILFEFANIERIEVLKGPQGTLFGRNASGGLIHVITREPHDVAEMSAEFGYGNFDTVRASGYVNVPLAENFAVSVTGLYNKPGEGWGDNLANGDDAFKGFAEAVRVRSLLKLSDRTSINANFLYSRIRVANSQGAGIIPGTRVRGGLTALPGFFDIRENDTSGYTGKQRNASLVIKHEMDFAVFTSITSRDISSSRITSDGDRSPTPFLKTSIGGSAKTWTQELQLASTPESSIQWALGVFYFDNRLNTNPVLLQGVPFGPVGGFQKTVSTAVTKSYAGYGQVTVPVGEQTNVTAGLRYTKDERRIDFIKSDGRPIAPVIYPTQYAKNDKLTWRLAVDHQFDNDLMVYASYSRGFKSGLFNAINPGLPAVDPQVIDAYEIGFKTEFLDRRVRLNVAAYLNDLDGVQVQGVPPGLTTPVFYNGSSARIKGVDVEFQAAVTPEFTLRANLAYADAKYGDGFNTALFYSVVAAPGFGLSTSIGNASGNKMMLTPEWQGSISGNYTIDTSIGEFSLAANYSYLGRMFFDVQNRVERPVVHLVNGTIQLAPTKNYAIQFWARNLLNEEYYGQISPSANGDVYFPSAPRTYGATFKINF